MQIIGIAFYYYFLPSVQTRGGILVAWNNDVWFVSNSSSRSYSVSVLFHHVSGDDEWWVTTVYDPCRDNEKGDFLAE
jgi:hypothetical protein